MAATLKHLMYLSYIGTKFCGSQKQGSRLTIDNLPTVQNSVEIAFQKVFPKVFEEPPKVRFCSRTDAGVHALKAAACVNLCYEIEHKNKFLRKINKLLVDDEIRIWDIFQVPDTFSFKKCCAEKTYSYRFGVLKKNCPDSQLYFPPFFENKRTYFCLNQNFDLHKAQEAGNLFVGEKNFGAFVSPNILGDKSPICNILSFSINKDQPQFTIDSHSDNFDYYYVVCRGTRFLYHLVRRMAGVVIAVGTDKITLQEVNKLFEKPEISSWTPKIVVLPGYGLYLTDTVIDINKASQVVVADQINNYSDCEKTALNESVTYPPGA